uniref:tyrosine-type recombinase/integrase n=1 Tax=Frankia sp. CIT1 TaxID=2880974 RepID=UPI001EF66F08
MRNPDRVQVAGPLARYAEGFRGDLARRGYCQDSAARQLLLMAHLSQWMEDQRLDAEEVTRAFVAQRREDGHTTLVSVQALDPLLDHLSRSGVQQRPAKPTGERFLARYAGYLRKERGLVASTVQHNIDLVRPFVAIRVPDVDGGAWGLSTADVTAFVVSSSRDSHAVTAASRLSALRCLLRFLHVNALVDQPLVGAVPRVALRRLAGLPKALAPGQPEALLARCDPGTRVGLRDRALLTVVYRLALRASEAAQLRLDDIDWRHGEVVVHGKGDRYERIPLPVDVGEALVAYLR